MIPIRPSNSGIWTKCALAPRLWLDVPSDRDGDSDPARQGTCAAWLAEQVLQGHAETCADMLDAAHPNGWVVDHEMVHHVQGYVDMLRARGGVIDAERRVRLNDLLEGTADAFGSFSDGTIACDDLKYGFDPVEVTSPQIVIYAGALVRLLTRKGQTVRKVTLGIYQPRAYHPSGIHRTRTLWPEELMQEVHRIEAAGQATQRPDAVATPGAHCRYCKAAHLCSAVAGEVQHAVHRMINGQQRQMTPVEIAQELEFLDVAERMFKSRKEAVRAEATARMDRGERIPGWIKQQGYGRRKWVADPVTVRMVTGIDPTAPTTMVSPAELERRGADKAVVAKLTETPRTAAQLKPVPEGYYAALFGAK